MKKGNKEIRKFIHFYCKTMSFVFSLILRLILFNLIRIIFRISNHNCYIYIYIYIYMCHFSCRAISITIHENK